MPKVLTLRAIKRLNDRAVRDGFRYALDSSIYEILDDQHLYPVSLVLPHDDTPEMRVRFVYNEEGHAAWLDMTLIDWDSLPSLGN